MKYYLGIDLGGTKVAFGIADENKTMIAKTAIPTLATRPYETIMEDIGTTALSFLQAQNIALEDVATIGMGIPGMIDPISGLLDLAPNLGWKHCDVAGDLSKIVGKPVKIANDADCAALGELLFGAGKDYKSLTLLTLGTGVGGGVVMDGKIFGGGDGAGLELGHLPLVSGGRTCGCGNKGCLEVYASTSALLRYARDNVTKGCEMMQLCNNNMDKIDGKIVFTAASHGDEAALKTLETYTDYLADACYMVIMAFRMDALVLGGGISVQEELLVKPLRAKVFHKLDGMGHIAETPIVTATLGNDAGILGACFL